ncbi:MAG: carboxylesterase family protein [Lachnospiraceae bacterium]|nr:carboxylesterase family protein [Lachnospiraceae bacterium]
MAFSIWVVVVSVINLVVLELSKNIILGWIIALLAAIAMITIRIILVNRDKFNKKKGLIMWLAFIAVILLNLSLTSPPYKRVPAVANANPDVTEIVSVEQGDLTGVYNEDHSVKVYAGIPYAAAPVGELRFKAPQEAESWDGVRACDHFGPRAMQPVDSPFVDSLFHILGYHDYEFKFGDEYVEELSEDCLYLNVFAPEREAGDTEKLPVLFFIHGGSLKTGTSSYTEYRGEDLAKEGVIVVNFAYRLGTLANYTAEDLKDESLNGSMGNYGLLDQIAALNWVYDNIEAFGGDKDKITIAGESAGASSVNALCVSPLTEGKFRYAIAESSGIVAYEPYHTFRSVDKALEEGAALREEFGVSSSAELMDIPAEDLINSTSDQTAITIDGYALTEQPYLTYLKGENHEQALLNGFNGKESDPFLMDKEATSENYVELLREVVGDYAEEMAEVVPADWPERDQHFVIDKLGDAKGALNTVYSAAWFSYSHELWNNYLVAQGKPCFEYYFTKTNDSLSNYHSGEMPYAYGNLWRHPDLYDEEDYALSDIMVKYWANFVKWGDPNGEGLPKWEMRTATQNKLLKLDTNIEMIEDPNTAIYDVIDKYQDSLKTEQNNE